MVEPRSQRASTVDFHARYARALALVAPHCDIVDRLEQAPRAARVRGVLFKAILESLQASGKADLYRDFFDDDFSAVPYYPLADYLVRMAVAGAVVTSPRALHEGMYELSRINAKVFAESLIGRVLIRLLARDPVRLTEQAIAARRQMSTYGRWSLVRHGPKEIEVAYEDEYVWIESAIAGSAIGTFETQNMQVTLETRLADKYNGSTFVRW